MPAVFMTSEFAIVSIDDELAAFLADYDAYAGVDGLIPVETAPLDADAPVGDPLVIGEDVAAPFDGQDPSSESSAEGACPSNGAGPFGGQDPSADDSDAFIPIDPGSIDPDAPPADPALVATTDPLDAGPVIDPMLTDDGATFDPVAGEPAPSDPAADGDIAPPPEDAGLSAGVDPAADPGLDAGSDLFLTFEDLDLGSELGVLMVGRSLHAFEFSNLP